MARLTKSEIRLVQDDPAMAFVIAVDRHFRKVFRDMRIPYRTPKSEEPAAPVQPAFNATKEANALKRKTWKSQIDTMRRQLCKVSGENERLLLARIEELEEQILNLDKSEAI